ncbi:MAG: PQQ-binding-like beta-propeller repeat protein, partial [Candidatus Solibacter usitatus]|nr:PQQ-binding-like beta-propeller repeat protein [Candidatus Solibacter usitatus]
MTIHAPLLLMAAALAAAASDEWPQFRGPNASGVSGNTGLPFEFGPDRNVVWKTPLPPGHSSPVLAGDSIFVTAVDQEKLFVISLDRATGRIKWRREVPRPRREDRHKANSAASPSVASDGRNAYAFFTDFGLMAFGSDGNELWRIPLGPFNNPMGMGASPVLAGDKLLMICDQESGSFFLAVDKRTGKTLWRAERSDFTRGFSTPILYQPKEGGLQAIVAGSYQLTAYSVDTGQPVWWTRGLTWQLKPTPVLSNDMIFVQCWAGDADNGQQETIEPFAEALKRMDRNH